MVDDAGQHRPQSVSSASTAAPLPHEDAGRPPTTPQCTTTHAQVIPMGACSSPHGLAQPQVVATIPSLLCSNKKPGMKSTTRATPGQRDFALYRGLQFPLPTPAVLFPWRTIRFFFIAGQLDRRCSTRFFTAVLC